MKAIKFLLNAIEFSLVVLALIPLMPGIGLAWLICLITPRDMDEPTDGEAGAAIGLDRSAADPAL